MSAMAGTEPGPPFFAGFEKWVNTLPMKWASWAFAFDAIFVCFASRYSTENGGRLPRFFRPPIESCQKMGETQRKFQNSLLHIENII